MPKFQSLVLLSCVLLAGCGLPRGAAFESELLSVPSQEADSADFAVFEVNRMTLPVINSWPLVASAALPWPVAQEQPASLIIAAGDRVDLTIWDAEENSLLAGEGQRATPLRESVVSSDGRVFVPYIGDLRVAGMSPDRARARIEEELVRTIPSAQVQLRVVPGRANTANVVSGVMQPGAHQLPDRNFKILDLIAQSGGANPTIANPHVRLIRGGQRYGIPLARLLEEPRLNAGVQGGDQVMIVDETRQFVALGASGVQAVLDFPQGGLTALEAIAMMGGVNSGRGNPESVMVMREYPSHVVGGEAGAPPQERMVFVLDLTSADGLFSAGAFQMQDGDLVYATESAFNAAFSFGQVLNLFGISLQ